MNWFRRQLERIRGWLFGRPASPEPAPEPESTAWCLVGNIVQQHPYGEDKELRHGSKHFSRGTKVYCLPPQWGDGYERVVAVGLARGSRRWITVVMRTELITNWRAQVVYQPSVLQRIREGFDGWNRQWTSRKEVETAAEALRQRPPRAQREPST